MAQQPGEITRSWFVELIESDTRLRCSYRRSKNRIIRYTVQLECLYEGDWKPVVRYDNAHGFCHRDVIHADGRQEKSLILPGDANESLTTAIEDLKTSWREHRARYLAEVKQ